MRFFLLLAVLGVGLIIGVTEAKAYKVVGNGTTSCGAWTAHRINAPNLQEQAWVVGFLSGVGFIGQDAADPLEGVDAEGVWAWVDNYCRANPIEHISRAAAAFYYAHPHP